MILYIVRHAWAGERDSKRYPDDGLRPLTREGRARFAEVSKKLVARDVAPQIIATSPLVRCRETAELLRGALRKVVPIVEWPALAPDSDLAALIQATNQLQLEAVAWVGHAPDVSTLAAVLAGGPEAQIRFAKGACAALEFEEEIGPGEGELQWLATAKLLGC